MQSQIYDMYDNFYQIFKNNAEVKNYKIITNK